MAPSSDEDPAVTRTGEADSGLAPSPEPLHRELAGRYVLIDEIGAGGAGVVFRAWDRELERRVAIKLLKSTSTSEPHTASTRLRREAQANALLQHPNVVSIFDVNEHRGEVFIAMEYVGGGSLKAWLSTPRTSDEILDAFLGAGRGLLSAHEKGVVHRDFKPSNVLMSGDGRALVADFGLARALDGASAERGSDEHLVDPGLGSLVDLALTRTGSVVGTPAYMAPEQLAGRRVDARADQFAFCLSLAEALTQTSSPRVATTDANAPEPGSDPASWLRGRSLPPRLRVVLVRGLAVNPEDRFPTLHPVLAAIERHLDRRRTGGRRATVAVLGVALIAVTATTMMRGRPCEGFDEELSGVWDEERREALSSGIAGGPSTGWSQVWSSFDRYARSWVRARTQVCSATRIRGEQSEELLDVRMSCLDGRLDQLAMLLSLVEGGRLTTIDAASEAVLRLPGPDPCLRAERSGPAFEPEDPERRAAVESVRTASNELEALLAAGLFEEGLDKAEATTAAADATAHERSRARARALLARFQAANDRFDEAAASWERAALLAESAGDDELRLDAYLALIRLDSGAPATAPRTDRNVERARALLRRRSAGPGRRAALESALSQLSLRRGDLIACRDHGERARRLLESAPGRPLFERIQVAEDLAICASRLGARKEAARIFEEALADAERELGPDHPRVARLHSRLSRALDFSGDREGAERSARRALEVFQSTLGPDHSETAFAHQALANAHFRRGDFRASADELGRAIEILTRVYGPASSEVGVLRSSLALSLVRLEAFEEALDLHRQAIATLTAAVGPRHPLTGAARGRLGGALQDSGDCEGAIRECRVAKEILEESDPHHARILDQIRCLCGCLIELNRHREARAPLLEGLALSERRDETPYYTSLLEYQAAQVWWVTGSSTRAVSLAETARDRVAKAGHSPELQSEIETWLETHAP